MEYSSSCTWLLYLEIFVEVLHHAIATLSWLMGFLLTSSLHWLFSLNFSIKGGSKFWHHIAQSWKVMARMGNFFSPSSPKDNLQLNVWWKIEYQGLYFGIMHRAFVLYVEGGALDYS